ANWLATATPILRIATRCCCATSFPAQSAATTGRRFVSSIYTHLGGDRGRCRDAHRREERRRHRIDVAYIVSTILEGDYFMPATQSPRSRRINLRTTTQQETLIRAGAKVRGVNVTDFILESACTRAEETLADQSTFTVTPRQWKAFTEALD